ncbi:MAG TPA: glucose/galactose MFS transporter [Bacteroidales bacterium]|nr:MAG: glucose/galactose MFS transporter [Bacteroidetes bacterium GWE2_42_24]OFY32758.1 MAG: glucose/galactose MFS transporter [Bacteroidetes bacterium GWF2_43_11]HAQ66017.1 glucose/galactose MFS transporter [Bacteroidales bacterium]HBZ65285.1 glucose/galactose MFS transporter [Bacteroidales bacterium]
MNISNQTGQAAPGLQKSNFVPALALLTSLFFMWGFITCLNDILIPHLKGLFSLNYTRTMLIQFIFFGAYAIMSIPSGFIVSRIGYQRGIVVGLTVTGIGALLFLPAAAMVSYPFFLGAFFVLASGITLLQVAANPFVAILGRPETASSRLSLTQAFNSLGTTIAPVFGSMMILENSFVTPAEEAAAVRLPYIMIAFALFLIALVFAFVKLPKIQAPGSDDTKTGGSAWQYRHLVLGAVAIFLYVGSEVSIGSFLVNFFSLPEIGGLTQATAGKYVAFYWGGAMIGRFLGSVVQSYINPAKVLVFNVVFAIILVAGTMMLPGSIAMWTIISVGLFNSIMFPTIFTLSIDGLGRHTGQGSGILCMAIVGGAILPLIMGTIADAASIRIGFIVPLIGYAYILYYAITGYKPRKIKT